MLIVTVELVSGHKIREVASMQIGNVSDLADLSSYAVEVDEGNNAIAETPAWDAIGIIGPHDRRASVWSLIAKAAVWAAEEATRRRR